MNPVLRCPLCSQDNLRPYGMIPYTRATLHFAQVRCESCDLLIAQPQATAEDARRYYEQQYYQEVWPDSDYVWATNQGRYQMYEWPLFESMWKSNPPKAQGRALDVGCGYGVLLDLMKEKGFQAEGCEPSEKAVMACRERGLSVIHGGVPTLPWPDRTFDLVCCLQVIEHVPDPAFFVSELVRVTAPGGVVAIATEDAWNVHNQWNRARARLFGEIPSIHTSPDHTFVFRARHLEKLLGDHGCDAINTRAFSVAQPGASIHWRFIKRVFAAMDSLFGHGEFLLATARRKP